MGILLTARRTARQLDPSIDKVLIKGSAHESSTRMSTGELVKDPLHYTFQFKNHSLVQKGKHWKAHAYVKLDQQTGKPINWYDTVLAPVREADHETLVEVPDEYYHERRKQMWNIWDPSLNEINEFSEESLNEWFIGNDFVVHNFKEKDKDKEEGKTS
ncbi:MAG: hypothetical protein Q9216_004063 [Gyalolechia sp. 2 TL-2023]